MLDATKDNMKSLVGSPVFKIVAVTINIIIAVMIVIPMKNATRYFIIITLNLFVKSRKLT